MHVPELRTASRRADRAAAQQWRDERRGLREEGETLRLQVAVVTDGNDREVAEQVRLADADVVGLLAPDALESLAWAAEAGADHGYSALDALTADAVDAACLDLPLSEACRVAAFLLSEGIHVALARPETPDRVALRELLDAAGAGDATVVQGLLTRTWWSVAQARRQLSRLGVPSQLTVLGWPAGRRARAELCDVVRRLCGDVVAVCGSASAMPVRELAAGVPVTLALLTADGTTVVASEAPGLAYADAQLTLISSGGRVVVGEDVLRVSDASGVRDYDVASADHPVRLAVEGLSNELAGFPSAAAGLGDLLAAARVLELAAHSYEKDDWVEA